MNANYCINELLAYALKNGLIEESDKDYAAGRLMELLGLEDFTAEGIVTERRLVDILSDLTDYAYEKRLFAENTVVYRDLFDTKIMGLLTDRPSSVIAKFKKLYEKSPEAATDYFYRLAKASNYIRTDRIEKDVKWTVPSEFGDIEITINLSKPEKDPVAIAAAKLLPQTGYPKCALCKENEGFAGNLSKAARQNLRLIPFDMAGAPWYLQYSPYVYYNEHCIALSSSHTPMKIDKESFRKLLAFVKEFPHYFIGSNADLPIVGGSILSHDHMQGGRHTFPMERAEIDTPLTFAGFEEVEAGIVNWPMSVIRLTSDNTERLVALADKILCSWRSYTDSDAFIFAKTEGEPHNTITPIARRKGSLYQLDLVLRNNITTEEHPLGVYHPHSEHHNVKKENIGLIEVMGLAVLPSRLKNEMSAMKDAILSGNDFSDSPLTDKHKSWFDSFKNDYSFTPENVEKILKAEIGKTFVRVLCDAGVYKPTAEGKRAFLRFIDFVNK